MIDHARQAMATQGWFVATIEGPLTRTPYKVYAVLAPKTGAPFLVFAAASILARLPRFIVVCGGSAALGAVLKPRVNPEWLTWGLAVSWLVFYALFWTTFS